MERIHIMINEDLLEEIIMYARKYNDNNLSQAIRNLLSMGLNYKNSEEEIKDLKRINSSIGYLKKLNESMYKDLSPLSYDIFNSKMRGSNFDD